MNQHHNTHHCHHCNHSPCLWSMYKEQVLDEVNGWIHTLLHEEDVPDQRTIRNYCYRTFVRLHYGVLPSGVQLPRCVIDGIHEMVADQNQWIF